MSRYIKWLSVLLCYALMYVLSVFIYIPIVYPFRNEIRNLKRSYTIAYLLWLFLNDTTKQNEKDIDFGDYGRYKHNIFGAFRQSVIRNNAWNFKLVLGEGLNSQITSMKTIFYDGKQPPLLFRNYSVWGYQFATYEIGNDKYFRASFTKLIGRLLVNFQAGTSNTRYLLKCRIKWL